MVSAHSRGYTGLSPTGSASSERTPSACYFGRASGRCHFARELGIRDRSFEARFVILVVEGHNVLEAHLVAVEIDLLDQRRTVKRAHVRIDSQPLLARAALGIEVESPGSLVREV